MKRLSYILLAGALVLSLNACARNDANPPADGNNTNQPAENQPGNNQPGNNQPAAGVDVSRAEATYKNNCASCHGNNLEGIAGPDLTKVGSRYSKEQIIGIIQNGKGIMPKNLVTGEEAENLAAWLASKK